MPMPVAAQRLDDFKKLPGFSQRERTGRLVHDDDAGVLRQRLGDLHHLHLPGSQTGDGRAAGKSDPDPPHQVRRAVVFIAPRDQKCKTAPRPLLISKKDIPGNVEIWSEHQFLMNQRNALPFGFRNAVQNNRLTPDRNLPRIRLIGPAQNLHERAFARPILAHQREHFPLMQGNPHVLQRNDARKALGDAVHVQQGRTCWLHDDLRYAKKGETWRVCAKSQEENEGTH